MENYKRDRDGNIEYITDLLGNKIPVPDLGTASMAVRYEGFDEGNLAPERISGWYALIGKTQKTASARQNFNPDTETLKQYIARLQKQRKDREKEK